MNIGIAAQASGLSARIIRYYERIALIPRPARSRAGYRVYAEQDVQQLRFIHHARDLGFSIEQVRTLLSLWRDRSRLDDEVRALALIYIEALNARITALQAMREAVMHLANTCDGDDISSGTGDLRT